MNFNTPKVGWTSGYFIAVFAVLICSQANLRAQAPQRQGSAGNPLTRLVSIETLHRSLRR